MDPLTLLGNVLLYMLLSVPVLIVIYTAVRLVTAAYFRSRAQHYPKKKD